MTAPDQKDSGPSLAPSTDENREDFERLYVDWFSRVGRDPGDFFDRVLSDDWVYIDHQGEVRGKAEYGSYVASVPIDRAPLDPQDLNVRLFGEIALVHGNYYAPGGAADVDRTLRFTAVWIHRGGRWLALAHHTSVVAGS